MAKSAQTDNARRAIASRSTSTAKATDANANSTAGAGNITVTPVLNDGSTAASAQFQTVDALPANNAAITFPGAPTTGEVFPHNLFFHRNALALVTVPLELPDSAVFKARADWRGYSIRVIKDYDITNDGRR